MFVASSGLYYFNTHFYVCSLIQPASLLRRFIIFLLFDPKNELPDHKNLEKEFKQHINRAKFHLSCVKRFGNRFGGGKGPAPYKATF